MFFQKALEGVPEFTLWLPRATVTNAWSSLNRGLLLSGYARESSRRYRVKNVSKNKYVKPALVVYGDFAKITKLTGTGIYTDAAFPRNTPIGIITFQS